MGSSRTIRVVFFVGTGREARALRGRRWVIRHGRTGKVVGGEVHCSGLDGCGRVIVGASFVVVAAVFVITSVFLSARLGRRPLHVRLMVDSARVGTGVHLLVARWSGTFLVSAFFAAGGSSCEVDLATLGHVLLMKNRGAPLARRARLGAVGGGCGATRIP